MDSNGTLDAQLIVRATAAAGLAKTAVDVIRTQTHLYSWVSPVAAFVLSFFILAALLEYGGVRIEGRQQIAGLIVGSCIATPLAIGATAVQSAVERKTSDQKVAEVQDVARYNQEQLVQNLMPDIAQRVSEALMSTIDNRLAEAARQGAREAIRLAKDTPAA